MSYTIVRYHTETVLKSHESKVPVQAFLGSARGLFSGHAKIYGPCLETEWNLASASTLPETNVAPENRPSQKETSIPTIHFQGLC